MFESVCMSIRECLRMRENEKETSERRESGAAGNLEIRVRSVCLLVVLAFIPLLNPLCACLIEPVVCLSCEPLDL